MLSVQKKSPSPCSLVSEEKIENNDEQLEEEQHMEFNNAESLSPVSFKDKENEEKFDDGNDNGIENSSQELTNSIKNETCKVTT